MGVLDSVLGLLPTLLIVVCEVVALAMIISRVFGPTRSPSVVGVVLLILATLIDGLFHAAMPLLSVQLGSAGLSIIDEAKSVLVVALGFGGLALLAISVITGSRRVAR